MWFSLLIRHCFLAFYTTSLETLYSTSFLIENVFSYLYSLHCSYGNAGPNKWRQLMRFGVSWSHQWRLTKKMGKVEKCKEGGQAGAQRGWIPELDLKANSSSKSSRKKKVLRSPVPLHQLGFLHGCSIDQTDDTKEQSYNWPEHCYFVVLFFFLIILITLLTATSWSKGRGREWSSRSSLICILSVIPGVIRTCIPLIQRVILP